MPTTTLKPDTHLKIENLVRRERRPGMLIRRLPRLSFQVDAERAVDAYLLDEAALDDFYAGKAFHTYGASKHRQEHYLTFVPPSAGKWYLIIVNPSIEDSTAIHYEVEAN